MHQVHVGMAGVAGAPREARRTAALPSLRVTSNIDVKKIKPGPKYLHMRKQIWLTKATHRTSTAHSLNLDLSYAYK